MEILFGVQYGSVIRQRKKEPAIVVASTFDGVNINDSMKLPSGPILAQPEMKGL